MPDIGLPELLIILVVVLLLFGPGRLSKAMGDLGKGVHSFREALNKRVDETAQSQETAAPSEEKPS